MKLWLRYVELFMNKLTALTILSLFVIENSNLFSSVNSLQGTPVLEVSLLKKPSRVVSLDKIKNSLVKGHSKDTNISDFVFNFVSDKVSMIRSDINASVDLLNKESIDPAWIIFGLDTKVIPGLVSQHLISKYNNNVEHLSMILQLRTTMYGAYAEMAALNLATNILTDPNIPADNPLKGFAKIISDTIISKSKNNDAITGWIKNNIKTDSDKMLFSAALIVFWSESAAGSSKTSLQDYLNYVQQQNAAAMAVAVRSPENPDNSVKNQS